MEFAEADALLEILDALTAAEVDDRIRQGTQTIYQALIEAELTTVIGAASRPDTVILDSKAGRCRPDISGNCVARHDARVTKRLVGTGNPGDHGQVIAS